MTEKKKRRKVVAEISAAHLAQFAANIGSYLSREEAIAFLNNAGHAYEMWKCMMQAGEEYITSALQKQADFAPHSMSRCSGQRHMIV